MQYTPPTYPAHSSPPPGNKIKELETMQTSSKQKQNKKHPEAGGLGRMKKNEGKCYTRRCTQRNEKVEAESEA